MLGPDDVAAWLVKTALPPDDVIPGWRPGTTRRVRRCLRPTYRLGLVEPGQRCLLWLSGRTDPGVHAVGLVAVAPDLEDAEPAVEVDLHLLEVPVPRAELVLLRDLADAEVLRMPAGSNPSYLTATQLRPVLDRLDPRELSAAGWGPSAPSSAPPPG